MIFQQIGRQEENNTRWLQSLWIKELRREGCDIHLENTESETNEEEDRDEFFKFGQAGFEV